MKRIVLLVLGALFLSGLVLAMLGILPAWQLVLLTGFLIIGLLVERSAYRRPPPSGRNLQSTPETFVDPASGKTIRVLYDPKTGERFYDESTD